MDNKTMTLILFVIAFISAAVVVLNVYEYRALVSEKNANDVKKNQLDATWGKLILEHQTLTTPAYIEKLSRSRLGMVSPSKSEIRYLVIK